MQETGVRFNPATRQLWQIHDDGHWLAMDAVAKLKPASFPDGAALVLRHEARAVAEWLIAEERYKGELAVQYWRDDVLPVVRDERDRYFLAGGSENSIRVHREEELEAALVVIQRVRVVCEQNPTMARMYGLTSILDGGE